MRKSDIFSKHLMFHRLDKSDGPIFGGMGGVYTEELIFGMLIGLHIWGAYTPGAYIRGAY